MMELPFRCKECNHEFTTMDEHHVSCPNCKSNRVVVEWKKVQ